MSAVGCGKGCLSSLNGIGPCVLLEHDSQDEFACHRMSQIMSLFKRGKMLEAGLRSDFFLIENLIYVSPRIFQGPPGEDTMLCLAAEAEATKTPLCVIPLKSNYNIYLCM